MRTFEPSAGSPRAASVAWLLVPALLGFGRLARAQDATVPGAVTAPYPTIENISLEWAISGDDDADGQVNVRFRKQEDSAFRTGLPLFRVPAGNNAGFRWNNKHSGSLFGLESGTTYVIELVLSDPDGGNATETLTVATRPIPTPARDARQVSVSPSTLNDALNDSRPGDVLVLADGTYSGFVVPNDGTPNSPIVIRAQNATGALVNGNVRIDGRAHIIVEGLFVRGNVKFNDADSITISGCTIETTENGIISYGDGVKNAYIVNNVVRGATEWKEAALGTDGDNIGEGIQLTGSGNVIAWNRVSGFRDCLSLLEEGEAVEQVSDDFYGNDLSVCADDAIEADFAMGNVRVYRNRIVDSFMGISSQPSLGGPTYFIRNVMYNVLYQPFKLQRSSVGDIGYHNTAITIGDAFAVRTEDVFSRATFRNNLFIGGLGDTYNGFDSGSGQVMNLPAADDSCSFDFDGYGSIGTGMYSGRVGDTRFRSLSEQRSMTTEQHAVEVDLSIFAGQVIYPSSPFEVHTAPRCALAAGGAAIDVGTTLANVNDGFSGLSPDLGACELGQTEPTYGPDGTFPTPSGGAANEPPESSGDPDPEGGGGGSGPAIQDGGSSSRAGRSGSGNDGARSGADNDAARGGSGRGGIVEESPGEDAAGQSPERAPPSDATGCSCSVPRRGSRWPTSLALALAILTWKRRRLHLQRNILACP